MRRACKKNAAFFFILLSAVPALAKKRPLNYRLRPKADAVERSTAPARPEPVTLMAGRWKPEVRAALDALIAKKGRGAPGYDAKSPPVAVLPWSDASVSGDPAELVFLRLVTEVRFRFDDAFWEIVPIAYGRQRTRADYEQFILVSSAVWTSEPTYQRYRKEMLSSYLELCRGVGRKECRSYLARLWSGWREDDARDYSKAVLDGEKNTAITTELIFGEPGDPAPLRARRGLRIIPEMRDLAAKLRAAGFDVWVIDDLPQPVLEVSAADYRIDPTRAYGVRASTEGARLGAGVLKPVPTRGGKTEVVQSSLGRPADLVVGRDLADFDLLSHGDGLRFVFDRDRDLVKKAGELGWLVQPSFAR